MNGVKKVRCTKSCSSMIADRIDEDDEKKYKSRGAGQLASG